MIFSPLAPVGIIEAFLAMERKDSGRDSNKSKVGVAGYVWDTGGWPSVARVGRKLPRKSCIYGAIFFSGKVSSPVSGDGAAQRQFGSSQMGSRRQEEQVGSRGCLRSPKNEPEKSLHLTVLPGKKILWTTAASSGGAGRQEQAKKGRGGTRQVVSSVRDLRRGWLGKRWRPFLPHLSLLLLLLVLYPSFLTSAPFS